jgi:hypothetical protein
MKHSHIVKNQSLRAGHGGTCLQSLHLGNFSLRVGRHLGLHLETLLSKEKKTKTKNRARLAFLTFPIDVVW